MRFVWQMDADGRLTIDTEEFVTAIGPQATATLGRPWREIATELNLDADGQIERAIASRDTWSGITRRVSGRRHRAASAGRTVRAFRCSTASATYSATVALASAAMPHSSTRWWPHETRNIRGSQSLKSKSPSLKSPNSRRLSLTHRSWRNPGSNHVPNRRCSARNALLCPWCRRSRTSCRSEHPVPAEKGPSLTPVERKTFNELGSTLSARLREAHNRANNPITTRT